MEESKVGSKSVIIIVPNRGKAKIKCMKMNKISENRKPAKMKAESNEW